MDTATGEVVIVKSQLLKVSHLQGQHVDPDVLNMFFYVFLTGSKLM